jgi:hypothetical protein
MIGELKSLQKVVAAAGTAEPLSATKVLAYGLVIKALAGNTEKVYIGGATVDDETGHVLAAGEVLKTSDLLPSGVPVDLSKVYIDSDENGEGVSVAYVETKLG